MVRALDLRLDDREFDSMLPHWRVTTLGKLFTPMCLSLSSSSINLVKLRTTQLVAPFSLTVASILLSHPVNVAQSPRASRRLNLPRVSVANRHDQ